MTRTPNTSTVNEAIHRFKLVDRTHHRVFDRFIVSTGISRSQHHILMALHHSEMPLKQHELAKLFEVSPAAMTGKLKRLEANGYIKRTVCLQDNRSNEIEITEKGDAVIARTHKWFESMDLAMFENFTEQELGLLITGLEKMQTNLDRLLDGGSELKGR